MTKSILTAIAATVAAFVLQNANAQERKAPEPVAISEKAKSEAVEALLLKMNELYVFPDVAAQATVKIHDFQKTQTYLGSSDAESFARIMTTQLQEITHDKHMGLRYDPNALMSENKNPKATKEAEKRFHEFLSKLNFGFQKVEILRGNIGYLKIDGFAPASLAGQTAAAAMDYLQHTDAMIIDLRENHGGEPEMVQLLASYFFDKKPVHLNDIYYRKDNKTETYRTLSKLPGQRYAKPVYLLTSNETFSGGEEFAYDLQVLKRATLIGETTGGGANPGESVTVADGFVAFIPTGRAINPITKTNWEGVGVAPDIKTDSKNALAEAHILALTNVIEALGNTHPGGFYQRSLESVKRENGK